MAQASTLMCWTSDQVQVLHLLGLGRAKTLPNEVTPIGNVSRTDQSLEPISSQSLNSDVPYREVLYL